MRPVLPVRFAVLSLPRPSLRLTAPQVYEEIGFDISPFLVEADYVETVQHQQSTKLFIVSGISEQARALIRQSLLVLLIAYLRQTGFAPQTRKEISSIAWHWVSDLPAAGCAHSALACTRHPLMRIPPTPVWPPVAPSTIWYSPL